MRKPSRRRVLAGMAGLAATAPLRIAAAYPDRPITLVVPFALSGSTDILARIVAEHLQRTLNGHTFLFNTMSVHTMNHALFAAMPFDSISDFSPITLWPM